MLAEKTETDLNDLRCNVSACPSPSPLLSRNKNTPAPSLGCRRFNIGLNITRVIVCMFLGGVFIIPQLLEYCQIMNFLSGGLGPGPIVAPKRPAVLNPARINGNERHPPQAAGYQCVIF
jgi:hypothetical protein